MSLGATLFNLLDSREWFAMSKALNSPLFVSGLLLFLAGAGICMNFILRSKAIEIPVVALLVVGAALAFRGWKESRRK
jgi:hypothetical protein